MTADINKIINEWFSHSKLNTYSELGRRVGVSQQTVSRWAHGINKPSPKYNDRIINAISSDYSTHNPDIPFGLSALCPLPLEKLTPGDFEEFCLDLFRYTGLDDIDKLGKTGDKQYGIDLYSNDQKTVIQCKQTREIKFNKTNDVINDYEESKLDQRLGYTPQRKILAVSASVTDRNAQKLENSGWKVYDIEKLSRVARNLQENQKIRLAETYFPNNRQSVLKNCLSVNDYTFGLTIAKSYFDHIDKPQNCFTLSNQYILSFSKLEALSKYFQEYHDATTSSLPIIVITSDNGVGKTRLLKEFCDKYDNLSIVVVEENIETKDDIACAFESDAIIIDDGQKYKNTIHHLLSAYAASYAEKTTKKNKPVLIISASSAYLDQIEGILYENRIQEDDYRTIKLEKPTCGQCYELVMGIIKNGSIAQTITNFSSNNPFIAATLATAIRNGQLSQLSIQKLGAPGSILHASLNNLAKYRCGLSRQENDVRSILDMIALVQPVSIDEDLIDVIKDQTNLSSSDINTIIEKLITAGILIKRKNKIHIYPDILGVYICHEYLKSGFESKKTILRTLLNGKYQINTLLNLALLDTDEVTIVSNVMPEAWRTIKTNYMNSSIIEQQRVLNSLVNISFYQPREAIDFVKMVLSLNDSLEIKTPIEDFNSSLRTIASILENIAHRMEYTDEAICILVELAGKFKAEEPRNNPALNVIQSLLRPNISKPIGYRKRVLDSLLSYIKKDSRQKMFLKLLSSPLDISSTSYLSDNKTITLLQSSYDNTDTESREICETILEYSQAIIDSNDLPLTIAAIELLGNIINYKLTQDGNLEIRNKIIDYLYNLCDKNTDPVIVAKIYLELQRCYKNTRRLDLLIKSSDTIIAVFTLDPYHHNLLSYETDYKKRQLKLKKWVEHNAELVIKEYGANPSALYNSLRTIREKANECKLIFNSSYLLGMICPKMTNDFNKQILQAIEVDNPGEEFQYAIAALLASNKEKQYCINTIKTLINSDNYKSTTAAANTVAYCFDKIDIKTSLELINLIVETNNIDAILILIQYSCRLLDYDETVIGDLLLYFCKIKDSKIALAITDLFSGQNGEHLIGKLRPKHVKTILSMLERAQELNYSAQQFIRNIANIFPDDTAAFLLNRVYDKHTMTERDLFSYTDIPYGMTIDLEKDALNIFLAKIISRIYDNIDQPMVEYNTRKILKIICLDEREILKEVIKTKDKFIENKDNTLCTVIEILLSSLDIRFIANNYDGIEPILRSLMIDGGVSKKKILEIFIASYVPSSKSRTPGSPSEYDLQLIDISEKALLIMPYDSILRQLFERVKAYAEQEISNDKIIDEEWGL